MKTNTAAAIRQFVLFGLFLCMAQNAFAAISPKEALLSDLSRIVSAIESDDWFMDEKAYDEALEQFMPSICRVTDSVVDSLQSQLSLDGQKLGEAQSLFKKYGELTDEVEAALHNERRISLLNMANNQKSNCPFWVTAQHDFKARQSGMGQLLLAFESGGLLQSKVGGDVFNTGGGGAARILGFYGFNSDYSLLTGFDFGGGAFVNPEIPEEDVDVRFFNAIPVIFRAHFGAWHGDFETALVSTFSADQLEPDIGWRLGGMVGFSTLRLRKFLPWAGLAFAVEQYPGSKENHGYFVKIGFRAGALLMGK